MNRLRPADKGDLKEGVTFMGTQRNLRKTGIVMMWVGVILMYVGGGCSQNPSRVYKIAYSAHAHDNPVSENPQVPQRPDNQIPNPDIPSSPAGIRDTVAPRPAPRAIDSYHLGSGDVLQIKIYQLTDLEKEAVLIQTVDRRGQVYLPLLNHVQAAGLTCTQLQSEISLRLGKEFIRDPRVNVSIREYGSKQVMVLGAVRRPGPVALKTDYANLMDVISDAGGIMTNAAPDIEILRGAYAPGESAGPVLTHAAWQGGENIQTGLRERVSIQRLFGRSDQQVNPLIRPGDVIKVPHGQDGVVYITGEVKRPGVKDFRRPLSILQAITSAGDITRVAQGKKCKLLRRTPEGAEQVIMINLEKVRQGKESNILLAQNDTLIIPADPIKKFFDDLDQMIRRGVIVGVDATYDAGTEMGWPQKGYGYR
jgi:polysaccharide biosynthesis/export protein